MKCLKCFQSFLPLASVIGGRVYGAHRGLFRSVATCKIRGKKKCNETSSIVLEVLEDLSNAKRGVGT